MKLTEQTLEVLSNFAKIQPNIIFREGNVVKTMASSKTIIGEAKVDVEFDQEFGVYNLPEFLATLGLVGEPVIDLKKSYAEISDVNKLSKVRYYYTDPDLIRQYCLPSKDIKMPATDVSFVLTKENLARLQKASATLGLEKLVVSPDGNDLKLEVTDPENKTANAFSVSAEGEFDEDADFSLVFLMSNFKMIPGDYEVEISKKLISKLTSKDMDLTYWIALEKDSVYR